MMDKKENMPDVDDKKDSYYSEELSRAAVKRLFDEDDDAGEDTPPPAKSSYVSGFDRNPDKSPTKNREPVKAVAPAPTEPPKRPRSDADALRSPKNEEDAPRPPRNEPSRGEGGASHQRPSRGDADAPRQRPSRGEGDAPHQPEEQERTRRRESATSRILNGDAPTEQPERPERPSRDRSRRRNPAPNPAVRVNVEHPVPVGTPQQGEPQHSEEDVDSFRRRYNAGELFSPPRNPNRPIRPGRNDVRTNRMKADPSSAEPISPLRFILVGAAILMLAIVAFLTWQLVSANSRYNEAYENLIAAQTELSTVISETEIRISRYTDDLSQALDANREYREILSYHQLGPFAPPPLDDGITSPGDLTTPGTATTPAAPLELPTTHVVAGGENLTIIARRFFPGVDDTRAITHIATVNNITDIHNVPAGRSLNITPLP